MILSFRESFKIHRILRYRRILQSLYSHRPIFLLKHDNVKSLRVLVVLIMASVLA